MKNKKIVFMGSSDFSLAALKKLSEDGFNIIAVYTRMPKPNGRNYKIKKTVVHEYAESKNIPVFTPKTLRDEEQVKIFSDLKSDITIVSSYGLIIPENVLDKSIFINIHGSLLPRWRGASPIQSAILAGDKETGISIMKMDAGLDTGDVILMKSVKIFPETTFGELSKSLAELGADMMEETLLNFDKYFYNAKKQSEEGACYASKISKEMGKIDWEDSCENILRKIKAFSPSPAAWMELNDLRIKILDASIVNSSDDFSKDFTMKCSDGILRLDVVQPAGKNKMSGQDFIRGYRKK